MARTAPGISPGHRTHRRPLYCSRGWRMRSARATRQPSGFFFRSAR